MLAVIVFILIIGLLIFVHELGHFLTARRNGIRSEEFGFGFPPRIIGLQYIDDGSSKGKWRIVWGSRDGDDENEKKDLEEACEKGLRGGTIYSLNWIPLGGFVKIKGENGDVQGEDSFASKGAWIRIKVLAAGVIMNFVLAWFLISFALMIGAPEPIDFDSAGGNFPDAKIQISEIIQDSPASQMGLKVGDEILKVQNSQLNFKSVKDVQDFIDANKGRETEFKIKRGSEIISVRGVPRVDIPDGQGPLGISLVETAMVSYPWYQAIWKGAVFVFDLSSAMLTGLFVLIKNIVTGHKAGVDVAGPFGIAVMTKQFTALGLAYVLQFAALLSINLGIINAFPFPALDGGRILFIIIEKIKGSPISQKTEQFFHSAGFALLILLMLYITFRDVLKFIK